jgi:hypothetical protein
MTAGEEIGGGGGQGGRVAGDKDLEEADRSEQVLTTSKTNKRLKMI